IDVILEIDWQGCQQIQKIFNGCISIFILPPSLEVLAQRLNLRNQDKQEIIQQRLADVREATSHINEYDYVILNDEFEKAVNDLKCVIQAERLSEKRQVKKFAVLLNELTTVKSII